MNTWKLAIYSYALVVIISIAACGDHLLESPLVMNPRNLGFGNYFEATVALERTSIDMLEFIPEQIISIEYQGIGSSNLLGDLRLKAYHEEHLVAPYITPRVEFGKFSLSSESSRDALTGTYTGSGSSWVWNIQGGSGKFMHTNGSLDVHLIDHGSAGITARISGYLNR